MSAREVPREHSERLQVGVTGCNSRYLDEHGVPTLRPWSARRFHKEMRRPRFADYDLVPADRLTALPAR